MATRRIHRAPFSLSLTGLVLSFSWRVVSGVLVRVRCLLYFFIFMMRVPLAGTHWPTQSKQLGNLLPLLPYSFFFLFLILFIYFFFFHFHLFVFHCVVNFILSPCLPQLRVHTPGRMTQRNIIFFMFFINVYFC